MSDRSQPTRTTEQGGLLPLSELNALIDDPHTPEDIRQRLIEQREERGLAPIGSTTEDMREALSEPAKPEQRPLLERIRSFLRAR